MHNDASDVKVERIDPQTQDQLVLRAVHRFHARRRAEHWPEDPPLSYREALRNLRNMPDFAGQTMWGAWRGELLAGMVNLSLAKADHNRHLAECGVFVVPEQRGRGLAGRLLVQAIPTARKDNRRMLVGGTDSQVPAGAGFARRLGSKPGLSLSISQLELAVVDHRLLRSWTERVPTGEFELGLWVGRYPEEEMQAIIALREVMNTAPREDLEVEDMHWTPEQLRELEEVMSGRGQERWTLFARHTSSRELAGYTEVFWQPEQAEVLQQGDTGVLPQYRGRGLGRWLKAAMLGKVVVERPQVKRVRTGNAGSNAPMLKINRELGFRERKRIVVWQVEVQRVLDYLSRRGLTAS